MASLGISAENADELREMILTGVRNLDAIPGLKDRYGMRYTVDIPLTRQGKQALVRTAWIIKAEEIFPRLTSCFVL